MDTLTYKGVYTWKNGARYEGEFVDNIREGKGKMTTPDQKVYIGDFKNNKKYGFGTFAY